MIRARRGVKTPRSHYAAVGFQLVYFLIGIAAILLWTYLFGHPLLEGKLAGNDSPYHLSIISWIDRWFPELPAWYPLQGVGSSSIVQYPFGAHYLVVILSHISGLTLTTTFRIVQFGSVVLTACGIYVLVWRMLKSQTMALIAGLLYPISMAAWHGLAALGLFAQSVSLAYFVPAFLLFDAYLESKAGPGTRASPRRRGLILLAASATFCLMIITHIVTAFVFAMTFLLYALLKATIRQRGKRLASTISNIKSSLIALLLGLGLSAFWLAPFLYVSSLANREGAIGEFALHQIPYQDLLSLIGLRESPQTFGMWSVTIASPVLILAAVGFVLSLKKRSVALPLAIISITFAVFTAMPGISMGIVSIFKKIWATVYVRGLTPTMLFLPVIAGYGAVALAQLFVDALKIFIRVRGAADHRSDQRLSPTSLMRSGFVGLLGLGIAVGAFVFLRHPPPGYENYQGYGLALREDWWPFQFDAGTVTINHWPQFAMSSDDSLNAGQAASELTNALGLNANTRLATSPSHGALLEVLPLKTDASTVGIYYYVGSLIRPMWGYQSATYWKEGYGSPQEVDEFARWMGIDYAVLHKERDPTEKYEDDKWLTIPLPDGGSLSKLAVRKFDSSTGLASVLNSPEILVIGGYQNSIYESVFRLFNSGVVTYQEGTIVEGSHRIDDYTLEELSQFEVVFLRGYDYKDHDRAWNLMSEYVQAGGSLFVDTGWQFWEPDWQLEVAPDVFPVRNLEWDHAATNDQLRLATSAEWLEADIELFAPMIWQDEPWGISTPTDGLRDWATPVLESSGKTIMAIGEYGEGKVIWSGMNLVGHIRSYENPAEGAFLRSLIQWLLPGETPVSFESPNIQRDHPDRITIRVPGPVEEGSNLLWREAYAPGWHASTEINGEDQSIDIFRAGPGMMLMHLPPSQGEEVIVTMEYSLAWVRGMGIGATALSGALLLIIALRKRVVRSVDNGQPSSAPGGHRGLRSNGGRTQAEQIVRQRGELQEMEMPSDETIASESDSPLPESLNEMAHPDDAWATKTLSRRKSRS